jgi:ribosomal protein S18 acetylase RimI-like enzyme
LSIRLIPIQSQETSLIAALADTIWHAYYIDFLPLEQIDYMLDKFYSGTSLLKQIEEGQEFFKIMGDDDHLCGFISISMKEPQAYFIHKFYLLPTQQGNNKGTEVMQVVKNIMSERSGGNEFNIRLTVNRQNYKAINFYFKNRFIIEEVKDFDIGNNFFMTDFVMLCHVKNQ